MSWQAMGAVQTRSQYREDGPENFAPYRIMMALAWYANEFGVIGQAGDHRRCPGQRTIADRAGVHRNTVANWLPQLIAAGELEIVASGGGGRGSWTQYRLLLPMDGDVPFTPETAQNTGADVPLDDVPLLHEIAQSIEIMAQRIEIMAQRIEIMAQQNGTNGTSAPLVELPDPCDPNSPDPMDPGGGESPPPPPDLADDYETAVWQAAQRLVARWCERRGMYRRIDESDASDRANYYAPAVRIIHEHGGDESAAWAAIWQGYNGMLLAGFSPKRLAPVVEQVLADMDRAAAPPMPQPQVNGRSQSRAAAAMAEYERLKEEFFND